jgi:hypothetical protein
MPEFSGKIARKICLQELQRAAADRRTAGPFQGSEPTENA